ncbi:MAG: phage holin [Aerococcus sp.]|nr:phage holin [Aerococcus sp.]
MVVIALPATIGLIQGIGEILEWEYTTMTVEIISVITVFLGTLLQQSTKKYWKELPHDHTRSVHQTSQTDARNDAGGSAPSDVSERL